MPVDITSVLHMFPPQKPQLNVTQNSPSHPVCLKITDYCAKSTDVSICPPEYRIPVFATVPKTLDRFTYEEIISEPQIFADLHEIPQEVELNGLQQVLDQLSIKVAAQAHHGACKLVLGYGAACSGHGALAFGVPTTYDVKNVPKVGLLWSLLDAVGGGDWPRVACFYIESGGKIRDLLSGQTPEAVKMGASIQPRTENGVYTPSSLSKDLVFLPVNYESKLALAHALHLKRRVVATWHALDKVIDRSTNAKQPLLRSILQQLGHQNHYIALDVCSTTCVLISLGPQRQNSQILLLDMPACCTCSGLADYKQAPALATDLRYAVSLKNIFTGTNRTRDNQLSRLIEGCVPELFLNSRRAEVVQIASVQISDLERAQTHQVLRMSSVLDNKVGDRYFDAYEANLSRSAIVRRIEGGKFQSEDAQRVVATLSSANLAESAAEFHRQLETQLLGINGAGADGQGRQQSQAQNPSSQNSLDQYYLLTGNLQLEQHSKTISVDELLKREENQTQTSFAGTSKGVGLNTVSSMEDGEGQGVGELYKNVQWQIETRAVLDKMRAFLNSVHCD